MHEGPIPIVVSTVLALDPDTKGSGWAYLQGGKIEAVGVISPSEKGLKGSLAAIAMAGMINYTLTKLPPVDLAVVEGQEVYRNGKADANNLLLLALVSGAALATMSSRAKLMVCPRPKEWKGGAPKGAHQARILDEIGWKYDFQGPKVPPKVRETLEGIPPEHVKEIVDAIGLALWGLKKVQGRT
jgi:hypothetical protein